MFEGKIPQPHAANDPGAPVGGGSASGDALRELTWNDLRARLQAAREFQASLQSERDEHDEHLASFDANSARHIAALADNKHAVNPEDLANGKGTACMDGASQDADFGSDPRK